MFDFETAWDCWATVRDQRWREPGWPPDVCTAVYCSVQPGLDAGDASVAVFCTVSIRHSISMRGDRIADLAVGVLTTSRRRRHQPPRHCSKA